MIVMMMMMMMMMMICIIGTPKSFFFQEILQKCLHIQLADAWMQKSLDCPPCGLEKKGAAARAKGPHTESAASRNMPEKGQLIFFETFIWKEIFICCCFVYFEGCSFKRFFFGGEHLSVPTCAFWLQTPLAV